MLLSFLKFKRLRFRYVKARHRLLKGRMAVYDGRSSDVGEQTLAHNIGAFHTDAVFGCGDRMGLLIYPTLSYYSFYTSPKATAKVLIVGCRSEDDVYWMKAEGFHNTVGLDLFSYSKHVLLGDIHRTSFEDSTFDVVLLGWMISYSKRPDVVVAEVCRRILKPGGLLGIGIDHDPAQAVRGYSPPRVNALNCADDLKQLLNAATPHDVVFTYDHCQAGDQSVAVVSRILK